MGKLRWPDTFLMIHTRFTTTFLSKTTVPRTTTSPSTWPTTGNICSPTTTRSRGSMNHLVIIVTLRLESTDRILTNLKTSCLQIMNLKKDTSQILPDFGRGSIGRKFRSLKCLQDTCL